MTLKGLRSLFSKLLDRLEISPRLRFNQSSACLKRTGGAGLRGGGGGLLLGAHAEEAAPPPAAGLMRGAGWRAAMSELLLHASSWQPCFEFYSLLHVCFEL